MIYIFFFNENDKQVIQLILEPFVGTDVSTRRSLMQRKPGCPKKSTCPRRRPLFRFSYNHCRSRISNSDRSGERQVHCPLLEHPFSYLITNPPLLYYCFFLVILNFLLVFFSSENIFQHIYTHLTTHALECMDNNYFLSLLVVFPPY